MDDQEFGRLISNVKTLSLRSSFTATGIGVITLAKAILELVRRFEEYQEDGYESSESSTSSESSSESTSTSKPSRHWFS